MNIAEINLTLYFECKLLKNWPTKKNSDVYHNPLIADGNRKLFIGFDMCDAFDAVDVKRCYK